MLCGARPAGRPTDLPSAAVTVLPSRGCEDPVKVRIECMACRWLAGLGKPDLIFDGGSLDGTASCYLNLQALNFSPVFRGLFLFCSITDEFHVGTLEVENFFSGNMLHATLFRPRLIHALFCSFLAK